MSVIPFYSVTIIPNSYGGTRHIGYASGDKDEIKRFYFFEEQLRSPSDRRFDRLSDLFLESLEIRVISDKSIITLLNKEQKELHDKNKLLEEEKKRVLEKGKKFGLASKDFSFGGEKFGVGSKRKK